MKTTYLDTLEDLAAKRRALGAVIESLAAVAGVDAAPYLDAPAAAAAAAVADADAPTSDRTAKRGKAPKPPRPQRPASPSTNGTGLEDKVLQALKNGPLAPKGISDLTAIPKWKLKPVMKGLLSSKRVKASGSRRSLQYQLT